MTFAGVRRVQGREFADGGAQGFKLVVGVARVDGFALVAGEFHPQFRRNARIGERAREGMAERVKANRYRRGGRNSAGKIWIACKN